MDSAARITLTFDNGPDPDVTPRVLDTLSKHDVRSTFFVVGERLREFGTALAKRARSEGHWIGNHTFSHRTPLGDSPDADASRREIEETEKLIGELAERNPLFRPFGEGGILDQRLLDAPALQHLMERRYTCVLWNAIPRDWEDPDGWVERALEQCRQRRWALLVLHDIPTGAMSRLPEFLTRARSMGAQFVQEFPRDCLLLDAGEIVQPVQPFVRDPAGRSAAEREQRC